MAYFAELDKSNVVIRVVRVNDDDMVGPDGHPAEEFGAAACARMFGGRWLQTSYNTVQGRHLSGGAPLRGNYASPGFVYDVELDAFIPPKPSGSQWVLDKQRFIWVDEEEAKVRKIEVTRV